jgi:rod shape-determining protein MreB
MHADTLYVGVDFGSFKTSIVASNGKRDTIPTAVGWPKDHVARALLGTDVVFGRLLAEAELALEIVRPFAKGALKYLSEADAGVSAQAQDRGREAARLILQHAVSLIEPPADVPVYGVIGAPSRASIANKQILTDAAQGVFDGVAIVAEPFTVAYGMKRLMKTLVVDIGAGTIDICPLYGTYPREEDQVTMPFGGDAIDADFLAKLQTHYPEAQVTLDMVREIKERHGFVHDVNESALITLPVDGVPTEFDVTEMLKDACKSIVQPMVDGVRQVVARVNPKYQRSLLENILLGGGGSQLKGLDFLLEQGLTAVGGGTVVKVSDSVYAGAAGALRLAMNMPASSWEKINQAKSSENAGGRKLAA